jgi:hypothetical protein
VFCRNPGKDHISEGIQRAQPFTRPILAVFHIFGLLREPETDIVVRVRRIVVQVERPDARVVIVVPITTNERSPHFSDMTLSLPGACFRPATEQTTNFSDPLTHLPIALVIEQSQILCQPNQEAQLVQLAVNLPERTPFIPFSVSPGNHHRNLQHLVDDLLAQREPRVAGILLMIGNAYRIRSYIFW